MKFHRLNGLNNRNRFSHSAQGWSQGVGIFVFFWGFSLWFAHGCLLALSTCCCLPMCTCVWCLSLSLCVQISSSDKDINHIGLGATQKISFSLSHLFESPVISRYWELVWILVGHISAPNNEENSFYISLLWILCCNRDPEQSINADLQFTNYSFHKPVS